MGNIIVYCDLYCQLSLCIGVHNALIVIIIAASTKASSCHFHIFHILGGSENMYW
jgi:hypothetical protein